MTLSFAAGATDTLIQAGAVARDGHLDLITTDANDVTLARSLKAMEFGRRANLSVRTQAGAGDATLIAGFVLGGAGAASATAAHAPAMPANASAAATGGVGAFPLASDASRDAALVFTPAPGAYTATVSGKAGTTGVALVEVYELP